MKKFLLFLLLLVLGGGGYALYLIKFGPESVIPYPYKWTPPEEDEEGEERAKRIREIASLKSAEQAHILFVGDRMAKNLVRYWPHLSQLLTQKLKLKNPLKIAPVGTDHLGLHRTLDQLKKMAKLPSVIIYHGASEEFYEKKFYVQEGPIILKNLDKWNDDRIRTLLMGAPVLSKVIYHRVRRVMLTSLTEDKAEYADKIKQSQLNIGFKVFETELEELIQLVQSRQGNLVLFTTPVNLEVLPRKVCQNSTSQEIIVLQNRVFQFLGKGDFKSAYTEILPLKTLTPGNALTFYLLGQTLRNQGKTDEAYPYLELAAALDCATWRASPIHNVIIRNLAKKYDIPLVDFDQMVNRNLGLNVLFQDEIFPQDLYYHEANKVLSTKIGKHFEL